MKQQEARLRQENELTFCSVTTVMLKYFYEIKTMSSLHYHLHDHIITQIVNSNQQTRQSNPG